MCESEVLVSVWYCDLLSVKDLMVKDVVMRVCVGAERACLIDSTVLCLVWTAGWGTDP